MYLNTINDKRRSHVGSGVKYKRICVSVKPKSSWKKYKTEQLVSALVIQVVRRGSSKVSISGILRKKKKQIHFKTGGKRVIHVDGLRRRDRW